MCLALNPLCVFTPIDVTLELYGTLVEFVHRITVHLSSSRVRLKDGGRAEWACGVLKTQVTVQGFTQCTALSVRGHHQDDKDDNVDDEHHLRTDKEKFVRLKNQQRKQKFTLSSSIRWTRKDSTPTVNTAIKERKR